MEQDNIQKTLEVKRQAVNTESARLLELNNKMAILNNEIELYKIQTNNKLEEMINRYKVMEQSYKSGNEFIERTNKFINSHNNQ